MKSYRTVSWLAVLATSAGILGGCSSNGVSVLREPDKIRAAQESVGASTFDLSRVVVVRLRIENQSREVTSIVPLVVSEVRTPDGSARTIFRVEQKTDTLTLFTRDPDKQVGYRIDIPIKDRNARPSVTFPILTSSGKTEDRQITVEAVFAK